MGSSGAGQGVALFEKASERTGHWIKMRRPFALLSGPEPSRHMRSLVGFIIATVGFRFSVHTARCALSSVRTAASKRK
jgi:hypothetical protein